MKQKFLSCFFLIIIIILMVFLLSSSCVPAVLLLPVKQAAAAGGGGAGGDVEELPLKDAAIESDSLNNLMMMEVQEDCENGEQEDCFNRRFLADAHLDYIYTQQHKP